MSVGDNAKLFSGVKIKREIRMTATTDDVCRVCSQHLFVKLMTNSDCRRKTFRCVVGRA